MTEITHDKGVTSSHEGQVFWISGFPNDEDYWAAATLKAWLYIGYDDIGYPDDLSSYKRAKLNAHTDGLLAAMVVKAVHKTDAVRWLISENIEFDVFPFAPDEYPDIGDAKVIIPDDNAAMRFKLMWCAL